MQQQSTERPLGPPDLTATEQRWRELTEALEAAEEALRELEPPGGAPIAPELLEQIESAKRRRSKVQLLMIDFLDTLDDMPP